MKISSRYHRLLIYDEKRTTKIDGMGPFKQMNGNHVLTLCTDYKFAFFVVGRNTELNVLSKPHSS